MGSWLRIRFGPVGYTISSRRKPQSYRAYKASRERREQYTQRYAAERTAKERRSTVAAPAAATAAGGIKGRTDPEFDGIDGRTLQRWSRYWQGVAAGTREPTPGHPEHPQAAKAEAAKVLAEIQARRPASFAEQSRDDDLRCIEPIEPRLRGITDPEFDGVSMPTLRAWRKFWLNEERSADHPLLAVRSREEQLRMVDAEIEARVSDLTAT